MAKNSREAAGAVGTTSLLSFLPESLTLVTDKSSPLYDERVHLPLDEAMVRNIMHHGVIEPIVARKNTETGLVEVIVGRQRVKCCAEANRRLEAVGLKGWTVPGYMRRNEKDKALAGLMASENALRQAETHTGRAEKMQNALRHGNDEETVAVLFGCSVQTVRSTLATLEAPKVVRDALDAGTITKGQVKQLAKLQPDEQREKLAELKAAGEGAKPHEKAAKQRAVLGDAKPKMRSRKEVLAKRDDFEEGSSEHSLLDWVLGAA